MIFIWGSKWVKKEEAKIVFDCYVCVIKEAYVCSFRRWFTFFFIPIFPTSSKEFYIECLGCENTFKLKDDVNVDELVEKNSPPDTE